jgi:hypothetical protein
MLKQCHLKDKHLTALLALLEREREKKGTGLRYGRGKGKRRL